MRLRGELKIRHYLLFWLVIFILQCSCTCRAKVPETCAEEVLTQVLSLIEVHFCQKMVPWVVRVIGQSSHLHVCS